MFELEPIVYATLNDVFNVGGYSIKGESSEFGVIDWILLRR